MRWEGLYLRACATALPPVMPAEVAVTRGLVAADAVRRMQVTGVAVAGSAPPVMAAEAVRRALARSGCGAEEIALLLHSCSYHQGHDMWAPASYVQRAGLGNRCPALEVRQTSNGGLASLELAAAYLTGTGGTAAMLSTADRFCLPGIDRWRSDPGTVLGDGATAAVLARGSGFARLESVVTVTEPELERMHRGDDPFSLTPLRTRSPVNVETTTQAFLRTPEGKRSIGLMFARQAESIETALKEAEVALADVDWFVLPHFGRRRLDVNYFRRFGITPQRSTWAWSRGIGHLGAGDQFAGLTWLAESGRLRPGQVCLLLGVGGGFSWSSVVLRIVDSPEWTDRSGEA